MTTYTAGTVGTASITLVASQVDTINFTVDVDKLQLISPAANTADIWYTLDGSAPAVGGTASYLLPPGMVDEREPKSGGATQIKVISSGTPTLRVQRAD